MFKDEDGEEKIVFPFPLFTTCVHMIVQFTLASLVLLLLPQFRPRHGHIHDLHSFHNHQSNRGSSPPPSDKPLMTKWFYATRIGPCGAATGLDIGLGNTSLKFISLTFYSMPPLVRIVLLKLTIASNVQILRLGIRPTLRLYLPP
jgi:solute carrier family 35 protein C2